MDKSAFDSLHAEALSGNAAAGLQLASMLGRMRPKQQHPDIDSAWEAAFSAPWDRPDAMAPAALSYLARHSAVEAALADGAGPGDLLSAAQHLSGRRLFQLVASGVLITSAPWQRLMMRWRAMALAQGVGRPAAFPGIGWVAAQAFMTRYLWPHDAPQEGLDALRARVEAEAPSARDVMLLACFEHPGDDAEFALEASDPAQRLLLERLYRAPLEERAIAKGLLARAVDALPDLAQRDQYERYPYPCWTSEPPLPAAIPAAAQALRKSRWWRREKVLLAGCGTGLQCVSARATHDAASITAIDFSATSLSYAVRKCREAGMKDIAFEAADLLAYAKRGARFDVVECLGVLHHLTDVDAGAQALRSLVRPGGLLRLAVYSASTRVPVMALREMIAARGLDGSIQSLRKVRSELLAGEHGAVSESILASPDFHSASGLHDLLFNACEHSHGALAWTQLMERHGFRLVCMDPPAATLALAGEGSQHWSPAQWEDFEREHPYAFASMYEFWFVAREG